LALPSHISGRAVIRRWAHSRSQRRRWSLPSRSAFCIFQGSWEKASSKEANPEIAGQCPRTDWVGQREGYEKVLLPPSMVAHSARYKLSFKISPHSRLSPGETYSTSRNSFWSPRGSQQRAVYSMSGVRGVSPSQVNGPGEVVDPVHGDFSGRWRARVLKAILLSGTTPSDMHTSSIHPEVIHIPRQFTFLWAAHRALFVVEKTWVCAFGYCHALSNCRAPMKLSPCSGVWS